MSDVQDDLTAAIISYRTSEFDSIRACARAFGVAYPTLRRRLLNEKPRNQAHESQQLLTSNEESSLGKWVSRLSKGGFPISLPLTLELAEEIRLNQYPLPHPSILPPPISRRWLDRFRNRHPELSTVYSRTIDASRINRMSYSVVSHYFEQLNSLFVENHYPADAIYNMDESGFSLGSTGNNKVIVSQVTRQELRKFKKIPGRQEWITSIECIGASGVTLPPLVIFKAKNTNSSWLPTETPSNWLHATSNSGWTSDFLTLEWLDYCFIPNTR